MFAQRLHHTSKTVALQLDYRKWLPNAAQLSLVVVIRCLIPGLQVAHLTNLLGRMMSKG